VEPRNGWHLHSGGTAKGLALWTEAERMASLGLTEDDVIRLDEIEDNPDELERGAWAFMATLAFMVACVAVAAA